MAHTRTGTVELVVEGGTVVDGRRRRLADVLVSSGRVLDVVPAGWEGPAALRLDARGMLVLPGGVDTHVHLMDPGDPARETFVDGTRAAAAAGVTTIVEHTHAWPVHEVDRVHDKVRHLRDRSHVDFGLAAHAWPDRLDELRPLWRAGVTFFKLFTCTTHGVPGLDPATLLRVLDALADERAPCLVHCEDEALTASAERLLRDANRSDPGLLREWRSREAELLAVAHVTTAASLTGARTRVAHASHPAVLSVVREARRQGASVSAETCPQYLTLREGEVEHHGALRKFTPPARIRSDAEEEQMWAAVDGGDADHIASDHAPSTRAQKAADIWSAPFGLPGLDTTYRVLVDAAISGRTTFERVASLYAESPARFYGLAGKGRIAPGMDADMVIVDPHGDGTVTSSDIRSKAGWSPYEGRRLRGRFVATILRGRVVAEGGQVLEHRRGRFLPGAGAHREPTW